MDHRNCIVNPGPVVRLAVPYPGEGLLVPHMVFELTGFSNVTLDPEYVYSYLANLGLAVEMENFKPERKQHKWPL